MVTWISTEEERKSVFENFLSLSSLQGINYLLPLIILPYLIRVIGPEKFGLIAFAQSLVQYFMILTDYGFNISATRQISLYRERKKKLSQIFSSVITVKLLLALVSFALLMLIINFIPRFQNERMVYLLSFGAVLGNCLFPGWLFQGTEKMRYIAVINIFCGALYLSCVFIFVKAPADFLVIPLLNSSFFIITGVIGLYIAFRKFGLGFVFHSSEYIAAEIKAGWSYFISVVSINAYTTSRIFAVGLLTNNVLTGYYSIAEKIANCVQAFPLDSFSQAVYPRLSKIFVKNTDKAVRLMKRIQDSTTFTYLLSIPVASLLAPLVVRIVCGSPYPEVTFCLRLLLAGVFFVVANAFKIQFFLVCNRPDIYSRIHIWAAILGLPLIFVLIIYYSYVGAAIATIVIELGVFIATYDMLEPLLKKLK